MYELRLLIEAFRSTTFYVLGAGASANIVPMTFQLKDEITHESYSQMLCTGRNSLGGSSCLN